MEMAYGWIFVIVSMLLIPVVGLLPLGLAVYCILAIVYRARDGERVWPIVLVAIPATLLAAFALFLVVLMLLA